MLFKMNSDLNTFKQIKEKLVAHYGPDEILVILAYGTRLFNKNLADHYSDYDITVVFKDYPDKALPQLLALINITVLFWPDIEKNGVKNFRLYNHGEFYIAVLAEAIELYGSNPFKELVKEIPKGNLLSSLKEQIALHCAKLASIILEQYSDQKTRNIKKYSFRIAQNFYFLLKQKIGYRQFMNTSYENWLNIFEKNKNFPEYFLKYLKSLLNNVENLSVRVILRLIHEIKADAFKIYAESRSSHF